MKTLCPHCKKEINPASLLRAKQKKRPRKFYQDMVNKRWKVKLPKNFGKMSDGKKF
ncbi:MAG: hypothetical protein PHN89_05565 [Candidatus Pacebacteria bacterium]|nr:hypothetical protein [Candidatus Paceibacterota bacterium]